jgi:three-Cys-motif partner protein
MSHEHHNWHIGKDPPLIRPHSLAKHRVLRAYLERYVSVLTANVRRRELKLTLVDGFAGGGRYLDNRTKEERPGSPLIMLAAMRTAAKCANEIRSNPFNLDVEYFFIEEKPEALNYLRNVISESEYKEFVDIESTYSKENSRLTLLLFLTTSRSEGGDLFLSLISLAIAMFHLQHFAKYSRNWRMLRLS